MKFNTYKILTFVAAVVAMTSLCSCDDIKEDDRFIELPTVEAKRVVLLEEFTGQDCSNCPLAHEVIETLLEQYPNNLISVGLHGGPLSYSEDKYLTMGLANVEGDAYYNENKISAAPKGIVNRSSGELNKEEWAAKIYDLVSVPTNIELSLSATLNPEKTEISITSDVMPYAAQTVNYQLWVIEDGIEAIQKLPDGNPVVNYVHNNVFRASVNGHNGETVSLERETAVQLTHTIAVRSDNKCRWNPDNLSIVGFFYDKSGVLQAAKCKVK